MLREYAIGKNFTLHREANFNGCYHKGDTLATAMR